MLATVATILVVLMGLSLIYVLIRTLRGRPVERRVVFIYIAFAASLPLFMHQSAPVPITDEVQILVDALEELPPG